MSKAAASSASAVVAGETELEQRSTEQTLQKRFSVNTASIPPNLTFDQLHNLKHYRYLVEKLQGGNVHHLDSSRPWLCYWPMHALDLLKLLPNALKREVNAEALFSWIFRCWTYVEDENDAADGEDRKKQRMLGGFSGGPTQEPMLASCWAACGALIILASQVPKLRPCLREKLDTAALTEWLVSLRLPDGGFRMFRGGEVDLRASYCAACIVAVFNLDALRIFPEQCLSYVGHCQSIDGGIACNITGAEGHGGYVSCGFKGLVLMHALREGQKRRMLLRTAAAGVAKKSSSANKNINDNSETEDVVVETTSSGFFAPLNFSIRSFIDLDQLRRWCALRQDPCTGGFNGRVNKLVDSCYSWWIGGSMAAIATVEAVELLKQQVESSADGPRGATAGAALPDDLVEEDDDEVVEQEEDPNKIAKVMGMRSLIVAQRCNLFSPIMVRELVQKLALIDSGAVADKKRKKNILSAAAGSGGGGGGGGVGGVEEGDNSNLGGADAAPTASSSWIDDDGFDDGGDFAFHQDRLAQYVLELSQCPEKGGLADKPPLNADLYHTCYSLSGLSTALVSDSKRIAEEIGMAAAGQNVIDGDDDDDEDVVSKKARASREAAKSQLSALADESYQFQNFEAAASVEPGVKLQATHPLLNLTRDRVLFALEFFGGRDSLL